MAQTPDLQELTRCLLRADPEIRDMVLFGSMAYAPDLAHDVDLLITTRSPRPIEVYWDAAPDFPLDVDVLLRQPGDPISSGIASSVCAWRAVLYGDGETIREAIPAMAVPTFEQVRLMFRRADHLLHEAQTEPDAFLKYEVYKETFGKLFDTARHAAQAFLNTDSSRWGELRRSLPSPLDEEFRRIINTVHIQYSYDGHYPKDRADEEYQTWRDRVGRFVDDLEAAAARLEATEGKDSGGRGHDHRSDGAPPPEAAQDQ